MIPAVAAPASLFCMRITILAALLPVCLGALPRFSLLSGQNCSSCHTMSSGGGMRNEDGWSAAHGSTIFRPWSAPDDNNLVFANLYWGFDMRTQYAYRFDAQTRAYKRRPFNMQIMPYVTYRPIPGIDLHAGVNLVKPEWPSQQRVTAAVIARPFSGVRIEAGFLQPDIGVRHDDHTTLTRSALKLFPGWNEIGASVSYSPFDWVSVSGGLFDASNRRKEIFHRAQQKSPIDKGDLLVSGKINLLHADYDMGLTASGGASVAKAGRQLIYGVHAGIGWIDRATLAGEIFTMSEQESGGADPRVSAFLLQTSYEVFDGVSLTGRYEQAQYDGGSGSGFSVRQYVIGAQLFIAPFVELRPEYRWTDRPEVLIAQWTGQLHLFF